MKGKILALIVTVLIVVVCLVGGVHYVENYDEMYYAKIDNSRIQELSSNDDMKYKYTLDCYDKNGKERELNFKTSRELREGAYIALEVRIMGVHKWEEVQYNDLPKKTQEKIK